MIINTIILFGAPWASVSLSAVKSIGVRIFMVASVRIKRWVGGSAEIRTLFRFVNPYELLDDP